MARHPASAARTGEAVRLEPQVPPPLAFAGVVELLTGLWRLADPSGFAAAMTAAPVVAGHPVLDLAQLSALERGPADPRSVALLAALEEAAGGVLRASDLDLDWVAAIHAGHLYVEARARLIPAAGRGQEAFVVAHAVEFVGAGARARRPALVDHSWAVLVLGDGRGGVAGIVRASLFCPSGCCPPPGPRSGFAVPAFRQRLIAPALAAHGLAADAPGTPDGAVVLPFRRRHH
jgi:hypothetical protein